MKAMVINKISRLDVDKNPLELLDMPVPVPGEKELLVKVSVCGVCHTELDEIEGRTPPPVFPMIPGHQVIGRVAEAGRQATRFRKGERVGIAWIHSACGTCKFCLEGNENLCADFEATGRDAHGGYAGFTTVREDFAFPIPDAFTDFEAAPLLCAGTIGYRSLRLTDMKDGENLALIGFGASAHLVIQMARYRYPNSKIFVFARSDGEREFARELGAYWTGDTSEEPPERFHRAIDTTPVWGTIVDGLKNMERGGRFVINAIRKEEIDKESLLMIDYPAHLWLEKEIKTVANVTGKDVQEFLDLAARILIKPEVQVYRLEEANQALTDLKEKRIRGAKVLKIS
jgi:propanol-preferring alcohol dehydrogenase